MTLNATEGGRGIARQHRRVRCDRSDDHSPKATKRPESIRPAALSEAGNVHVVLRVSKSDHREHEDDDDRDPDQREQHAERRAE